MSELQKAESTVRATGRYCMLTSEGPAAGYVERGASFIFARNIVFQYRLCEQYRICMYSRLRTWCQAQNVRSPGTATRISLRIVIQCCENSYSLKGYIEPLGNP